MNRKQLDKIVENAFFRHKKGDLKYAYGAYHSVLQQSPNHPQALHYLGLIAQQTGNSDEAIRLIEKSIKKAPTDTRAYNHLAQIFLSKGKKEKAKKLLQDGLQYDSQHIDSLNNLANLFITDKKVQQAIELYRKVIQLEPNTTHSTYNLAQALKQAREYNEALEWYENTINIDPNHYNACYGAGFTCEELGKFEKAINFYTRALSISPQHVKSIANLLAIKSFHPDKSMVDRAEKILKNVKLDYRDIAKLNHGLGKYYDREKKYDQAFQHFHESCQAQKQLHGTYDSNAETLFFDNFIEAYDQQYFTQLENCSIPQHTPVFIVGMPRSGTTLTEQILASHPHIFGAGELVQIPFLSKKFAGEHNEKLQEITPEVRIQAANEYTSYIHELDPTGKTFHTDKLPMNFMYLGFISSIFPNAKIIHCRRNPLDIGLSCFIETFNLAHDFSIDLEVFGHYFMNYHRIMEHWKAILPIKIYDLKYEDLVTNQEVHTRELLSFIGLEWREECLHFYDTERAVNTPSRWQVRQPIYNSSQARWKNYKKHLSPLIKYMEKKGYNYQ